MSAAGPAEFERRYGTQAQLLEWTNTMIERLKCEA